MSNLTTPRNYNQPTCPHAQSYTEAPSTHARAGALVFSSSCLDESITRVAPGQYPLYTRAWSARKAVGCSQTTHHSTPPPQTMSPTTFCMRRRSLAWQRSHGRTHGNSHDDRDRTGGAQHARPRRGDRHPHAALPDADPATARRMPRSCAPSDGAGGCVRGGPSHRVRGRPRGCVVTTGKAQRSHPEHGR